MKAEEFKQALAAANIAYNNAMYKCLSGADLAAYMFLQGFKYKESGEMPKDLFLTKE